MWQKHNRNVVAGALVGGIATDVQNCESNQHRLKQYSRTCHHNVSIKQIRMSICFSDWFKHSEGTMYMTETAYSLR